jgi:hypothetical protein
MTSDWLADIVIVNESGDERTPGDVGVFRSAGELCGHLEHWWVEEGYGFAFTAAGERLTLDVDGKERVIVAGREDVSDGTEIVRGWLHASAAAILDARKAKAAKGRAVLGTAEGRDQLPASIEGLIAYVGFNRG